MVMTRFIVVDIPLAYNMIIGRPILNRLKVMISTYQMMMKFLIIPNKNQCQGDEERFEGVSLMVYNDSLLPEKGSA